MNVFVDKGAIHKTVDKNTTDKNLAQCISALRNGRYKEKYFIRSFKIKKSSFCSARRAINRKTLAPPTVNTADRRTQSLK